MRLSPRYAGFVVVALGLVSLLGTWIASAQPGEPTSRVPSTARAAVDDAVDDELLEALTPLDRQILEFVSESQLGQLLDGTHPSEIYLSNGETLDVLADRTQVASSRNLVFAPTRACRLFDTREAPEGALYPGETRGFRVRASETGYAEQGGAAEGCNLPGLEGLTLKTNTIRAVALNVLTVDVGGPGSLAIWPANRTEPEIGSVSFASALAGGGVTGGVLVPVCDEAGLAPCSSGDLKVRAKMAGAHVVADVVGYFHAPRVGEGDLPMNDRNESERTERGGAASAMKPAPERRSSTLRQADGTRPSGPGEVSTIGRQATIFGNTGVESSGFDSRQQIGDVPETHEPLGGPIYSRGLPPGTYPYPSGIKGVLATGHGAGAALHAVVQEGDGSFEAGFYSHAVKAHVFGTGNGVHSFAEFGRAIYGQTRNGYAVYGFDGGSSASASNDKNQGYAGYFYSTNGIGVYGYSGADRSHPNIYAPGVYGQSNRGVGVYGRGDTSNSHNFYNEGGYFEGGRGLYARGTDAELEGGSSHAGYGARFYSDHYRALYALGDNDDYDAHFDGGVGIIVDGVVVRRSSSTISMAVNVGGLPIAPGDLVGLAGTTEAADGGSPMLAVTKLDPNNPTTLIGVASEAFDTIRTDERTAADTVNFYRAKGNAAPKGVLSIITDGLAPEVNVSTLSRGAGWQIGDRLELSANGTMSRSGGSADGQSVGRVASAPDPQTGKIAVFLNIN